ncbi:hypothetical protein [Solwaraspora sp. WMMA2101]|uniref:hypothetical protein n=1 Tax=Solwaraspora sp. WMMA2101 TaxID=3404124 RepID=UPI003B93BC98
MVRLIGVGLLLAALGIGVPTVTGGPAVAAGPASVTVAAPPLAQQTPSDEPGPSGEPAPPTGPVKYYRVQLSFNGEPEFLFAIAERFLGDGNRAVEIFELNEGRLQPDGNRLTDPAVISPNWILQVPEDAEGEGVEFGALPTVAAPPAGGPQVGSPSASTAPTTDARQEDSGGLPVLPVTLAAVVLLLAAGVGFWWWRRTRVPAAAGRSAGAAATSSGGSAAGGDDARPAAGGVLGRLRQRRPAAPADTRYLDIAAGWTVDRALRVLASGCAHTNRAVPHVYGVSLDDEQITLRLSVADPHPVVPWTAGESGRVWTAPLRATQELPLLPGIPPPCPRLVTLGTCDGRRELVNLGEAGGLVSVGGDRAAARALVLAWAAELSASPWADGVQVVIGGVREAATNGRILSVGTPREALVEVDAALTQAPKTVGVLFLASAPSGQEATWVQDLVAQPHAPWVVVVLGQSRQDRWRFTVSRDGQLDTGVLGMTVYAAAAATTRPVQT